MEIAAARYQTVQVTTSNPGDLLIALLDGLFKFLNQARTALRNNALLTARKPINRSHAIVSELYASLDHSQAPELCKNLEAVYGFCLDRILYANLHNDPNALDDVVRVLSPIREAFTTAVRSLSCEPHCR